MQLSTVYAQVDELKFKHFTVEDGLSQSSVYSIMQDSKGFMWFGTQTGGLNKYDGYSFKYYKHLRTDTCSISGNTIIKLFEDSKGYIWAGTRGAGLNRYNPQTDCFTRYYYNIEDEKILPGNTIPDIFEDENGRLWIASTMGLYFYDYKKDIFYQFIDSLTGNRYSGVTSIQSAGKNRLFIATKKGIYLLDTKTNTTIKHLCNDKKNVKSISDNYVTTILLDSKGRLWAGTHRNGLNRLIDTAGNEFTRFTFNPENSTGLIDNIIRTISEDKNGNIWIGTQNGLEQLVPEQQEKKYPVFLHHQNDENNTNSINENSIYSFYCDNDGNIWVGNWTGGVNYLDNSEVKFKHYHNIKNEESSLSNNAVSSFAIDNSGLWVGTIDGLNLLNRETNRFTHYTEDLSNPKALQNDHIKVLYNDSESNLWVGTFNGLYRYNKSNNNFTYILKDKIIYAIAEGNKSSLWIGTSEELIQLNKTNQSIKHYLHNKKDPNSISDSKINSIYKDKNNNIWIGTKIGLNLYNESEDNFTSFYYSKDDITSLSNDFITSIIEDNKGNLWIGTLDGLNMYDPINKSFVQYNEKDGFPDNTINSILVDNSGDLWIATNKGLTRFNPMLAEKKENYNIRNFDMGDGLQGNEFIRNSCYKSKSGELYFGGINGYNVFHPDSIKYNTQAPNVYITEFKLFNKPVVIGAENSPLSKHITYTKTISLKHKQSVISFTFVALNYISPEKNQYAYMMEGFEKEWNYCGNKREATYTNLPAGDYVFRVKASNNDGVWNTEGASLHIKVIPPIWKTWWFRIAIAVLLASIIYIYYSRRLLEQKKINRMLEMKVQERTYELNEKNVLLLEQAENLNETNTKLEERQQLIEEQSEELTAQRDELVDSNEVKDKLFSVIAHDLKNPFGAVLGFLELLHFKYHEFDELKRMKIVSNTFQASKTIYDLLTSLLDWSRSQMGKIDAIFNPHNINDIITSNIELASIKSKDKEIEIISDIPPEEVLINIDKDLISTVVRNLISNAMKFTPKGGTVVVSSEKQADKVIIKVRDNGVGISKDLLPTIFQRGTHHITYGTDNEKGTGLGLLICQEFVKLHKGEIWVESEEGKGSVFSFSLPLEQES
jgi:signal transduction histidine kinase/ligand-binding sensor domain-containing protein